MTKMKTERNKGDVDSGLQCFSRFVDRIESKFVLKKIRDTINHSATIGCYSKTQQEGKHLLFDHQHRQRRWKRLTTTNRRKQDFQTSRSPDREKKSEVEPTLRSTRMALSSASSCQTLFNQHILDKERERERERESKHNSPLYVQANNLSNRCSSVC
jgi:hypothetical protein